MCIFQKAPKDRAKFATITRSQSNQSNEKLIFNAYSTPLRYLFRLFICSQVLISQYHKCEHVCKEEGSFCVACSFHVDDSLHFIWRHNGGSRRVENAHSHQRQSYHIQLAF